MDGLPTFAPVSPPPSPLASRPLRTFCFSLSIIMVHAFLVRPSGSVRLSHGIVPAFSMIWKRMPSYTMC